MKDYTPILTEIIEDEELTNLVTDFSKKFGFCAFIIDQKGKFLIEKQFIPEYCKEILMSPKKAAKCYKDTLCKIKEKRVIYDECWAGYRKLVIPIKFKETVIAYWVTCGVPLTVDSNIAAALANMIDSFVNNFLKAYEKWFEENEFAIKLLNELISQQDYDRVLEKIVFSATEILKTDRTTLFIYDGEKLVSRIAEGIEQEISLQLGEGVAGRCAVKREIIILDEVKSESGVKSIIKEYTVNNLICAPIIFKKKLLGVIESFNKSSAFTIKDKRYIAYLADAAAIALNNAQTFLALQRMSILDPLTQLYNRTYFVRCLEKETIRLNRYVGQLSLMFIDLDDFKKFNDLYGHTVGDIVLKEFSNLIKENLREADIAARFGGEEFVVMLPNTDREGAYKTAQRLQEALKNTEIAGHKISASIGIACYKQGLSAKVLIDRADKAMYHVKKTQKGTISFWD